MLIKKWALSAAVAVTVTVTAAAMSTSAANAAERSPSAAARPAAVSPKTPSSCQGSPSINGATVSGTPYIELHTWTECFGTVDAITSHLELQKWVLLYPGTTNTEGEWEAIAGPVDAHFAGVTSTKLYQNANVKCSTAGWKAEYRSVAWATWLDSSGLTGTSTTGYSPGAVICGNAPLPD